VEDDYEKDGQTAQSFDVWPETSSGISPRFYRNLLAAASAPSSHSAALQIVTTFGPAVE